jgi:glycosyltransferase involved in cell wall biosynthesis
VQISLSILGSLEDPEYLAECKKLIGELPVHVVVECHGEALPERVDELLTQQSVFFFPTRDENFGHVIFESLAAIAIRIGY